MTPQIRRADLSLEYPTEENCFILEVANDTDDGVLRRLQSALRAVGVRASS